MKNNKKVAIVGMGRVGGAIAYNLGVKNLVNTIYAIDYKPQVAEAQVSDLQAAFIIENSKTTIKVNDYENLSDVDVVIITAGVPTTINRLDSFNDNAKIMQSVVQKTLSAGFKGIYLLASNPVDVITQFVQEESGFATNKVIGTGTILDNARFKYELSKDLNVSPLQIKSTCIGEHGSSIVPIYSQVKINDEELQDYLNIKSISLNKLDITERVINAAPKIFTVKGATEFGIASSVSKIVNAIINDTNEKLLVTSYIYIDKVGSVYLSTISTVNKDGAQSMTLSNISQLEYQQLVKSAEIISSTKQNSKL